MLRFMEKLYSIQEVSQILGMSKDTLRYYDRIGIVSPSRRRQSVPQVFERRPHRLDEYSNLCGMRTFLLTKSRGNLVSTRWKISTPHYCEEVAVFLDAKNAETHKKIAHLEKVSRLLNVAAETLRDFNNESDQRLAEIRPRDLQGYPKE